jgi:uncharacterized phage-like protein YoqJ
MLSEINPTHAVCFSGHRPDRLPGKGNPDNSDAQELAAALREHIENAVQRGKHTFLHGVMAGWDIFAAEQIISLKEKFPLICLVSVAPYREQFFSREKCWTPDWVSRAKEICRQTDIGRSLAINYRAGIYYERNRVLVDHSSELISFWDGGKGGTAYTVQYAQSKGLTICNLYEG